MKKRLLIICSIIGVLLAGFQFPIYAEETTPDYSSSTSIVTSAALDQYFYDNYELLPYIESSGDQYIDTGIKGSSYLRINCSVSSIINEDSGYLFGSYLDSNNRIGISFFNSQSLTTYIYNGAYNYSYSFNQYDVINVLLDKDKAYFNNNLVHTFDDINMSDLPNIFIFVNNQGSSRYNYLSCKLYRFSIYDYAANNGEGALVRDYYPARSKSGGVIGLYDAVSKTFVTTSGSVPFASPTGDPVNLSLGANINQFLTGSLSWIGAIFEGINEMPIIWVFIAIALAGVMFRWARRIVHF